MRERGAAPAAATPSLSLLEARRLGREWLETDGGVPRVFVPIIAALTDPEPPSYPGLRLDEYAEQAQKWLDSHLPHDMTDDECVPCQMATNLILVCNAWFEAEGWLADERAGESDADAPAAANKRNEASDPLKRKGELVNMPLPTTYEEVARTLREMADLVEAGDSYEGSIEYSLPDEWAQRGEPKPEGFEKPEVLMRYAYRVGNRMGQGGVRIFGSVTGPDPSSVYGNS